MGVRIKRKLPKFLEIEQLTALEKPLIDKVKNALGKENMKAEDKIAIRDFAVLTLVYSCALRISEALNLKLHNVDLYNKRATIIDSKGDDRIVSIPGPVIPIIENWLKVRPNSRGEYLFCNVKGSTMVEGKSEGRNEKPLGRTYYNRLISRLADETGVRMSGGNELVKPHPHTLRHTRAINLRDNNVEIDVIQKMLGHRNISTTQVYADVRQQIIDKTQQENLDGIVCF